MTKHSLSARLTQGLVKLLHIQAEDLAPCLLGFGLLFSLFIGYFCMRPVRDTMGVLAGVDQLHWLFSATFICTLMLSPVFAYVVSKVRRMRICRWVFGCFAINILLFAGAMSIDANNPWLARIFFVWLSVFNLIVISLAWSVLNDTFDAQAGKRLFALMATGASCGGLVGPLLGFLLVPYIGHSGLLILAACMLLLCIYFAERLFKLKQAKQIDHQHTAFNIESLGGNPWQGFSALIRSRYVLCIALFVILLASVSTFLYIEQARLVALHFEQSHEKTQFFAAMDMLVQTASLLIQLFFSGRIALRFGIASLLCIVPLSMVLAFICLSFSNALSLFVLVMCLRRIGEYALVRPGREMLFALLPSVDKYKAKNLIDTVIYRAADALSSWLKASIDMLFSSQFAALSGAVLALIWFMLGRRCAQYYQQHTDEKKRSKPELKA